MASKRATNIIAGTGIGVAVADNAATGQQDVTITNTGGAGVTAASTTANPGAVGVAATATILAQITMSVTATIVLDFSAVATISNISETLSVGSDNTLVILDNGAPLGTVQGDSYAAGESFSCMAWTLIGQVGFAAGNHTFALVATASAGAGNAQVAAGAGRLNIRTFGA